MRLLYGRHYACRYRVLAELVPEHATVVDVCCGPGTIYKRHLREKSVRYTGIDVNRNYIRSLIVQGARGEVRDVRHVECLPPAEIVMMQASLYHFLPNARFIIEKMLAAVQRQLIVSEPIRNLADSRNPLVASVPPS